MIIIIKIGTAFIQFNGHFISSYFHNKLHVFMFEARTYTVLVRSLYYYHTVSMFIIVLSIEINTKNKVNLSY